MPDEVDVDFSTLHLLYELFERQAEHMQAISTYVDQHCTLAGDLGVPLQLLEPSYSQGRTTAVTGFAQGGEIARHCADIVALTAQDYAAVDGTAHERSAAQAMVLDTAVPAYVPPGTAPPLPLGAPVPGTPAAASSGGSPVDSAKRLYDAGRDVTGRQGARWLTPAGADWLTGSDDGPKIYERVDPSYWMNRELDRSRDTWANLADDRLPGDRYSTTSTYRDQSARFRDGFTSGQDSMNSVLPGDTEGSRLGPRSVWLNAEESRVVGGGLDLVDSVAGLYDATTGAYESVTDAVDAGQSLDRVRETARGPANTGGIDWARGGDGW